MHSIIVGTSFLQSSNFRFILGIRRGCYFYNTWFGGNEVFKQSMHSGWGVESASYIVPDNAKYSALISIKGILFIPVESEDARFMISP
jgi:hypothetical protein